jgi:hypothetical protein
MHTGPILAAPLAGSRVVSFPHGVDLTRAIPVLTIYGLRTGQPQSPMNVHRRLDFASRRR